MRTLAFILAVSCFQITLFGQSKVLVFQSDFGLKDGAVAAMKGVAITQAKDLRIFDITHEIPAYNIWEAAYRLNQSAPYWPPATVFVSVVDPGVGSARRSIVLKTKTGHFFVTPDNGTLTLIAETMGVSEVRLIDETRNRRENSQQSYTFHGRDVYAFTGARLAAGIIRFDQVGALLNDDIIRLPYQKPVLTNNRIQGTIDILDVQYGNVWTNIDNATLDKLKLAFGDKVHVRILKGEKVIFDRAVVYGRTFADVPEGEPVAYLNSLLHFSLGINMGNFAGTHQVSSGPEWRVELTR